MIQFSIDEEKCIQCGECVADCPAMVLSMGDYPQLDNPDGCYRCQHCFTICPTGALSILGKNPDDSTPLAGNLPTAEQTATLIKGRRTVRRYQPEDVAPELIDELVQIACHAPTGVNAQDVLFTVVRTRAALTELLKQIIARLEAIAESGRFPEGFIGQYLGYTLKAWKENGQDVMFRGAPHLLITSAPKNAPCPVQDTHIALTTFELMARAKGLGCVWDGIFMMALSLMPDLTKTLGIPEDHAIGFAMAFGKPAVTYARTAQRGPASVNYVG